MPRVTLHFCPILMSISLKRLPNPLASPCSRSSSNCNLILLANTEFSHKQSFLRNKTKGHLQYVCNFISCWERPGKNVPCGIAAGTKKKPIKGREAKGVPTQLTSAIGAFKLRKLIVANVSLQNCQLIRDPPGTRRVGRLSQRLETLAWHELRIKFDEFLPQWESLFPSLLFKRSFKSFRNKKS